MNIHGMIRMTDGVILTFSNTQSAHPGEGEKHDPDPPASRPVELSPTVPSLPSTVTSSFCVPSCDAAAVRMYVELSPTVEPPPPTAAVHDIFLRGFPEGHDPARRFYPEAEVGLEA